jgi:hypothetical protein
MKVLCKLQSIIKYYSERPKESGLLNSMVSLKNILQTYETFLQAKTNYKMCIQNKDYDLQCKNVTQKYIPARYDTKSNVPLPNTLYNIISHYILSRCSYTME